MTRLLPAAPLSFLNTNYTAIFPDEDFIMQLHHKVCKVPFPVNADMFMLCKVPFPVNADMFMLCKVPFPVNADMFVFFCTAPAST